MSSTDRKILILPFALETEDLREHADFLSRQLPVLLRNCFEKERPGRVVTSPIASELEGERRWVLHSELWSDEAAARFARERGYDIVIFGALHGPATAGSERQLKLRGLLSEDGKVLIDRLVVGDVFRMTERSLEAMAVYIPMIPKQAVALFESQTESAPAYEHYLAGLDALLALRSTGIRLAEPARALADFEAALALSPDFEDAVTAELSCALQAAEEAGAEIPTATVREALEGLIAARPEDPRPYAVLAEVHIHRQDLPGAIGFLHRGLAAITPPNLDLLRRSGDVLVELGRKDAAIEAYTAVLAAGPDPALSERLASLEIMLARNESALARLLALVEGEPGRIDLQARCALLLHRMDRKDEAWARFAEMFRDEAGPDVAELVKLNTILAREPVGAVLLERVRNWYPPENFGGRRRVLLGKCMRLLGARFEAGLCLKSVIESELDDEHRALLARERLNLLQEDFDQRFAVLAQRIVNDGVTEGAELLEFAIEEEPGFWPARFLRGLVLSRQGQYEASLVELEQVLDLQPENDVVWYTRGLQYARLGRDREAVGCFESAIRLNGSETDYHSNLALSLARLKDEEAARAALERVRSLRPDDPENQRLEQAIEESL